MLRSSRLTLILGLPLFLFFPGLTPAAQQSLATKSNQEPPTTSSTAQVPVSSLPSPLTEALALYRKGRFDEAITKYQGVLHDEPNSPDAYAGLIRTYLKKKDVQLASETAQQALQVADSAPVRVALGEVYFRQGKDRRCGTGMGQSHQLGASRSAGVHGARSGALVFLDVQKRPGHDRESARVRSR
jgi:tetratricopeptide (TPR) repeat protein